jgi:organic radical activating enzyme
MSNPYKTREGGATVTVFVPYDCGNHCPFCINKKEYADCSAFSLDAILKSIHTMDAITPRCDFVFTGGEPFADLPALQRMLDAIPATHKIYINTTFPVQKKYTADEMIAFTEKNQDKITCINISRHLVKYVEESPDEVLARIACPTRINCVLFRDYPTEKLPAYVDRFRAYRIPIQFRYDYTETTPENLYEESHDKILHDLKNLFTYRGLDGCRMRNGYHFSYNGLHMTYHKTLPYSTITEIGSDGVTYDILYDILIKQTGEIHSDWTGVKLDVDAYRKVVYEPYDLRVLDGTVDF